MTKPMTKLNIQSAKDTRQSIIDKGLSERSQKTIQNAIELSIQTGKPLFITVGKVTPETRERGQIAIAIRELPEVLEAYKKELKDLGYTLSRDGNVFTLKVIDNE